MRNLTEIQNLLEPLLPGLLGVRLTSVAPDAVRAEMDVRPQLCTVGGVLHGGAIMTAQFSSASAVDAPRWGNAIAPATPARVGDGKSDR